MNFLQGYYYWVIVLVLFLQLCPYNGAWFGVFSSSSEDQEKKPSEENPRGFAADFTIEPLFNVKGMKKLEDARNQMAASPSNSCWHRAFNNLFSGCAKALADVESRGKFAWALTDCFRQHSGRGKLPYCDPNSPVTECLKAIDLKPKVVSVYLEYLLLTNTICYQLQVNAFKQQSEKLVNELVMAAELADIKLLDIEEQSDELLQNSEKIDDSLTSLDKHSQELVEVTKDVQTHVSDLFNHTTLMNEQFMGMTSSQMELIEGQNEMRGNLEEGMAGLREWYNNLDKRLDSLRDETVNIGKEMNEVGEELSSKMNKLQSTAEDISNTADTTSEKQKEMLDGQSEALNWLQVLTKFQSEALEKTRETAEQIVEFSHKHTEENLRLEEHVRESHDSLIGSSKTILESQKAFEATQSSIFAKVNRILSVFNIMLLESRVLKASLIYLFLIIFAQIFTSIRQTCDARPMIHIFLVVSFFTDCFVFWWMGDGVNKYQWSITLNRAVFVIGSIYQIVYCYIMYRDYTIENYQKLKRLEELENENIREMRLMFQEKSEDSEISGCSWLVSELSDDLSKLEDHDCNYPEEDEEEVGPKGSKRYNLRRRHH